MSGGAVHPDVAMMERAIERRYGPLKPYRPQRVGCVYFIQSERGGLIKIGWARDPQTRMRELQVAHPYRLVLLGVMAGKRQLERELHERFAACRCPYGEWFEPAEELLAFIESPERAEA